MTPQEVLTHYGNYYRFGKQTKFSDKTLANWMKRGYIPKDSQYKLERITQGLFKAGPFEDE